MLVGLMLYYLGVLHVAVESTDVVHKDLQLEQILAHSIVSEETRAGYYFQPHKNWINGESSLNHISILILFSFFYCYLKSWSVIPFWSENQVFFVVMHACNAFLKTDYFSPVPVYTTTKKKISTELEGDTSVFKLVKRFSFKLFACSIT